MTEEPNTAEVTQAGDSGSSMYYARGQEWTKWRGGTAAPADWNGGRVILADDQIVHPYQSDEPFDWEHYASESGCIESGCIVGYISARHRLASRPDDRLTSVGAEKAWENASRETERLSYELDITNADHIVLWLENQLNGHIGPLAYIACRILDAHQAALAAAPAMPKSGDREPENCGAISDDAVSHLRIRSQLNRAIYSAVRNYEMGNMSQVDDRHSGYPLVDLMSNPAPADIGTGEMEMVALVDEIEAAIRATDQRDRGGGVMDMFQLNGMRVITSDVVGDPYEDWSAVRSPSRARRRRKQGHSQRIVNRYRANGTVYHDRIHNALICHPHDYARIAREIAK